MELGATMAKDYELEERKILSEVFEKFNKTLLDLRSFQHNLEREIKDLKTELALKNQELSNIVESLNSGLIVVDLAYNILSINRAAKLITGLSEAEAKQRGIHQVLQQEVFPPDFFDQPLEIIQQQTEKRIVYQEPSGKKLDLAIKVSPMLEKGGEELLGGLVHFTDITPMKKLEEIAERKNRLEAMGQIAATVAHEIRNPLGGMELFVSLLKKDLKEQPAQLEVVTHLQSAMRSMNHIISNILEYANPRSVSSAQFDLWPVLVEFQSFYSLHAENSHASLEIKNEASKTAIEGDKELIRQALLNLYMNAVQAMPNGGKIVFSLSNETLYDAQKIRLFPLHRSPKQLETLKIDCIDEGEGMSEEVMKKLFDPFFTTKQKGTGLGLSILRQIVASHHGIISVESFLNKGSKVTLQLPLAYARVSAPLEA